MAASGAAIALLLGVCRTPSRSVQASQAVSVDFTESSAVLRNPDVGFQGDAGPAGVSPAWLRDHVSLGYGRMTGGAYWTWAQFHPAEDVYDFALIDDLIGAWEGCGKVGFRIRPPEGCVQHFVPDWALTGFGVEEICDEWDGGPFNRPRYEQCAFQELYGQFVQELARRYDGHPAVSFVDIGTRGRFGEWWDEAVGDPHDITSLDYQARVRLLRMFAGGAGQAECLDGTGAAVARSYDYVGFEQTPVVVNWGGRRNLAEGLRAGGGGRMDIVGAPVGQWNYYHDVCHRFGDLEFPDGQVGFDYDEAWPSAPVVGELSTGLNMNHPATLERIRCFVRATHMSAVHNNGYASFDQAGMEDLLRVLGYRLAPVSARYTAGLRKGELFSLSMIWRNAGSAPVYRPYPVQLIFRDPAGRAVARRNLSETDVRDVLPAAVTMNEDSECTEGAPPLYEFEESFPLPAALAPGTYSVYFALVEPGTDAPAVELAINGGADREYFLGALTVSSPAKPGLASVVGAIVLTLLPGPGPAGLP